MSEIRPEGGIPGAAWPGASKGAKGPAFQVPSIPRDGTGSPPLIGRVTTGAPLLDTERKQLHSVESQDKKTLASLYEKGFFKPGYELMYRTRLDSLYAKEGDYSWSDEHNDKVNFEYERAEASGNPAIQATLALRYLVGLGTDPSEEKFLRVMKGHDPESDQPLKGWISLEGNPEINYQYFRFLRDFQGADLLDASLEDPKALVLIESLEKAAAAGHPKAKEIWASDAGAGMRDLQNTLKKK